MVGTIIRGGAVTGALVVSLLVLAAPVSARHKPSPPPPPPPPTASNWQLVDYQQKLCFSSVVTTGYFGIWISGTWTHAINIGIDGLPPGGTFWTSYAPIAPGTSTGIYSLAYVAVQLSSTTPVGTTTASLWASDGTTKESVPVTIAVQASCKGY